MKKHSFFESLWPRLSWWLFALLLLGTPLHALFATLLLYKWGLSESVFAFFIMGWKELLVGVLFVLSTFFLLVERPKLSEWQRALHLTIPAFLLLGVMVTVFSQPMWPFKEFLMRLFFGGRTEFAFLMAVFSASVASLSWSSQDKKRLLNLACGVAVAVLLFGFFLLAVGHEWLTNLGFRPVWSTFEVGQAPAFCQKEAGDGICRLQSSFTDPNRYAAYLFSAMVLFWVCFKNKFWSLLLIGGAVFSLFMTHSMSGFVAACGSLGVGLFFPLRWLYFRYQKTVLFLCALAFVGGLYALTQLHEGYFSGSNAVHFIYMQKSVNTFLQNPWGQGLGVAGPASFRVGVQFLPESWWLQVMINVGFFGFLLFLAAWLELLNWKKDQRLVWMLLIGLLIQNLFLHTFEEAGVYTVWALLLILL